MASIKVPLLGDGSKQCGGAWRCLAAWILAVIMWLTFVAWISVFVFFPTINLFSSRNAASKNENFLGMNGLILLVFGGPILLVAILATVYLQIKRLPDKKQSCRSGISLWTYPVLVDGLLGVVTAAEVIFIFAVLAYVVWAMTNFFINDKMLYQMFVKFQLIRDEFTSWELWVDLIGFSIGLLGLVFMSFLFIPVARGSPLLRLIDIPFEHAVKYHVWLGHLTMVIFTLHGLSYVVVWTSQNRLIEQLFAWPKTGIAYLPGVISLLAGLLLWFTSFGIVRQGFFELFFYTHQLYIVFIVFMAFHIGDMSFCICLGGIFLYMLDRFLRFCQSRRGVEILSWRVLPCGTIELTLPKPQSLKYNALSFVFLNIPGISFLQWHPFSVSSSPYDGAESLAFLVKPLGSWTEELQTMVTQNAQKRGMACPLLGVEGPYGHESDYYLKYQSIVLVAGGIGVSPFIAIIRDILHRYNMNQENLPQEITLIWAVKSSKELNIVNTIQAAVICPDYASRLTIIVQAYVTRETEPDLEAYSVVKDDNVNTSTVSTTRRSMSTLVATYSNIWTGVYILVSALGFLFVQGIMQEFYLGKLSIPEKGKTGSNHIGFNQLWTVRASVLLLSMIFGMVFFGGLVIFCWNWIEYSRSDKRFPPSIDDKPLEISSAADENLIGLSNTFFGRRPDLKDIFDDLAKKWNGTNIGVLVSGPSTLQTSVARECRRKNQPRNSAAAAFHYHAVSFDL